MSVTPVHVSTAAAQLTSSSTLATSIYALISDNVGLLTGIGIIVGIFGVILTIAVNAAINIHFQSKRDQREIQALKKFERAE